MPATIFAPRRNLVYNRTGIKQDSGKGQVVATLPLETVLLLTLIEVIMGSWTECLCGARIHTNLFTGTRIYRLIVDSDYDAIDDPVDRDKLSNLFFDKGIPVYHCPSCGRLLVEWKEKGESIFYLPEAKRAEVTLAESAAAREERSNLQRLQELEAMGEAEYDAMYDSRSPTACYSNAKEAFYDAIALANKMGRQADVERLEKRLRHIKEVFRKQFV